jgi:hypothetical protein
MNGRGDGGGAIPRSTWIAIAIAALAVVGVAAVAVGLWASVGDSQISVAGWVAMILGAIVTLALGGGLMTLVFFSSRRGYDEPGPGPRC